MKILNKAELREHIFGLNDKEEFNWTTMLKVQKKCLEIVNHCLV